MAQIKVEIEGLDKLVRNTDPKILHKPLVRFFERAGITALAETQKRAPVDSDRLRSSLMRGGSDGVWSMEGRKPPRRLIVGTKVTHKGVSYPTILEKDPRYHYRGGRAGGVAHPKAVGPFAGRAGLLGKPTKGWFSGGIKLAVKKFPKFMQIMAREVENAWGNR